MGRLQKEIFMVKGEINMKTYYENEIYNIYSLKLAKYLLAKQYKLVSTKQMEENPRKTIFRFESSEALINDVKWWSENIGNSKRRRD